MRRRADPFGLRIAVAAIILAATVFWVLIGAHFAGRFDWQQSLTTMAIGLILAVLWLAPPRKRRR